MRKFIFSIIALISGGLLAKTFANMSYDNVILEKSDSVSIYSGYHSHSSHVSHYSSHTISGTDSIGCISNDVKSFASKKLLADSLILHRIYIADANLTQGWITNTTDSIYSGRTIVIITTEINNPRTIHWFFIPLHQNNTAFHTASSYINTVVNSSKSIFSSCPICADEDGFKPWMTELVDIIK